MKKRCQSQGNASPPFTHKAPCRPPSTWHRISRSSGRPSGASAGYQMNFLKRRLLSVVRPGRIVQSNCRSRNQCNGRSFWYKTSRFLNLLRGSSNPRYSAKNDRQSCHRKQRQIKALGTRTFAPCWTQRPSKSARSKQSLAVNRQWWRSRRSTLLLHTSVRVKKRP